MFEKKLVLKLIKIFHKYLTKYISKLKDKSKNYE